MVSEKRNGQTLNSSLVSVTTELEMRDWEKCISTEIWDHSHSEWQFWIALSNVTQENKLRCQDLLSFIRKSQCLKLRPEIISWKVLLLSVLFHQWSRMRPSESMLCHTLQDITQLILSRVCFRPSKSSNNKCWCRVSSLKPRRMANQIVMQTLTIINPTIFHRLMSSKMMPRYKFKFRNKLQPRQCPSTISFQSKLESVEARRIKLHLIHHAKWTSRCTLGRSSNGTNLQ